MKQKYAILLLSHILKFPVSQKNLDLLGQGLDEMGQMGWEMVAIDNGVIYFKRMAELKLNMSFGEAEWSEKAVDILKEAMSKLTKGIASG